MEGGIGLIYSDCRILGNYISNDPESGISLSEASSYIENNTIVNCSVGIHLIWLAGMNKIYNNTLIHNDKGISIWGSGGNSILNNTISKNNIGILVDGWAMDQAGDNSILNNTISNNNIGISLEGDSSGNVVANNRVELNTQCGVYINQIKDNLGEKYVGKESYYGINRFYNNIFNNTVNFLMTHRQLYRRCCEGRL